ncbi:hypothetical protein L1887_19793 [Cichorium endivia]|nr:hypothetical protein L1887_19793 [Cichorium endivia]
MTGGGGLAIRLNQKSRWRRDRSDKETKEARERETAAICCCWRCDGNYKGYEFKNTSMTSDLGQESERLIEIEGRLEATKG